MNHITDENGEMLRRALDGHRTTTKFYRRSARCLAGSSLALVGHEALAPLHIIANGHPIPPDTLLYVGSGLAFIGVFSYAIGGLSSHFAEIGDASVRGLLNKPKN